MAQPRIRNMLLGAVRDAQRVDVGTRAQGVGWKHVNVTDVIRIDDVYLTPDAEPAGVVDGAGTKWMDCSVYANVTLASAAPTTEVPVAFLVQDKLLWVSLTMRNLSEAQTAAIRAVPSMGRAHIESANRRPQMDNVPRGGPHRPEGELYLLWQEGTQRKSVHGGRGGEGSLRQKLRQTVGI